MKKIQGGILSLIGILAIAVLFFVFQKSAPQGSKQETALPPRVPEEKTPALDKILIQTNRPATPHSLTKRAADMTEDEKAKLAKDFEQKYKPLVGKWFTAYESRIPFRPEDFTLDKFHSRFGDNLYTFMIGDTTFTIQDSKLGLKVSYLMTRRGAKELNQLPGEGPVLNLNLPITKEDVIRMVKADSGVAFKPNEVIIKPTAAASALNGGAFVHLLQTGADPNNAANYKIDLVVGPDGKLVSYGRDPFF